MEFELLPFWPVPIYFGKVEKYEQVQKEIHDVMPLLGFQETDETWGKTHRLTDNTFSEDFINKYKLSTLRSEIDSHVNNLLQRYQVPIFKVRLFQSWMTSYKKGDYARIHSHADADISGVYYYKTNGDDGNIFFESPLDKAIYTYPYGKDLAGDYNFKPAQGTLIMFPGWLRHGVTSNTTENERHSISFNIIFEKLDKKGE